MAPKKKALSKSEQMARVKSRNTGLEVLFRKLLWRRGLRYRLHGRLAGSPDLVIRSRRTVVFIDGCFWHGCPHHYRAPATNVEFWRAKYNKNRQRDQKVNRSLKADGWRVIRVWEHEIRENLESVLQLILSG